MIDITYFTCITSMTLVIKKVDERKLREFKAEARPGA